VSQAWDGSDDTADLVAIGREANVLARRLAAAQQAAQDASATDPVESVRVVLTGDGRIAAVEVASR
jgi:hypothetical protein